MQLGMRMWERTALLLAAKCHLGPEPFGDLWQIKQAVCTLSSVQRDYAFFTVVF